MQHLVILTKRIYPVVRDTETGERIHRKPFVKSQYIYCDGRNEAQTIASALDHVRNVEVSTGIRIWSGDRWVVLSSTDLEHIMDELTNGELVVHPSVKSV